MGIGRGAKSATDVHDRMDHQDTSRPAARKRKRCDDVDDLGTIFGVRNGCQLEVLWDLIGERDEKREEVWWGCEVLRKTGTTHDLKDKSAVGTFPIYQIQYEAKPSYGYDEPSLAQIVFVDEKQIYDVESDEIFLWRAAKALVREQETSAHIDEDDIERAVSMTVASVFSKHESALDRLSGDAQMVALDKILRTKKAFTNSLVEIVREKFERDTRVMGHTRTLEIEAADIEEALTRIIH